MVSTSTNSRVFTKAANDMIKRLHMSVNANMQKKMHNIAYQLVEHAMDEKEFHDVTGNLINSYAVGVYYKGSLIGIVTSQEIEGRQPTRKTLKRKETYDLPMYYSGMQIEVTPYTAQTGKENYSAPERAKEMLFDKKPYSKKGFSLIMVSGAEYQKYFNNLTSAFRYAPRLMKGKI